MRDASCASEFLPGTFLEKKPDFHHLQQDYKAGAIGETITSGQSVLRWPKAEKAARCFLKA